MNYPRIKYRDIITGGCVVEENGRREMHISESLKYAPKGLKKAIRGHERVHFRMKNNFLNDCLNEYLRTRGAEFLKKIIPELIERYKREDLKQKLEEVPCMPIFCEIADELSDFSKEAVHLIAYCEAPDRDTKNWIAVYYSISDEIREFIKKDMKREVNRSNSYSRPPW